MTWIWMLVARIIQSCELTVESTNELELEAVSADDDPSSELAEVVAAAALALEEYAPDTDRQLLAVTARDGATVPVNGLQDAGLLVVDVAGRLGFTIGRGQLVTMLAGDLVTVLHPDASTYVAAYQLPGFKYWRA